MWFDLRADEVEKTQCRPKYTDNNIIGIENDVDALTGYVLQRMKGLFRFVAVKDLPAE